MRGQRTKIGTACWLLLVFLANLVGCSTPTTPCFDSVEVSKCSYVPVRFGQSTTNMTRAFLALREEPILPYKTELQQLVARNHQNLSLELGFEADAHGAIVRAGTIHSSGILKLDSWAAGYLRRYGRMMGGKGLYRVKFETISEMRATPRLFVSSSEAEEILRAIVQFTVDEHGHVSASEVARSSGNAGFDKHCLEQSRRWIFKPGKVRKHVVNIEGRPNLQFDPAPRVDSVGRMEEPQ